MISQFKINAFERPSKHLHCGSASTGSWGTRLPLTHGSGCYARLTGPILLKAFEAYFGDNISYWCRQQSGRAV